MSQKPVAPPEPATPQKKTHAEKAIDEALKESFPASDPIAVDITKLPAPPANKRS